MRPDKLLPTIALIFGLMSPAAHGFSVLRWESSPAPQQPKAEAPPHAHTRTRVPSSSAGRQGFRDMLPEVGKLRAGDTILKIGARAGMPNGESFAFFASSLRHRPAWREAPYQARVRGRISPEVRQMDHQIHKS